MDDKDTPWSGGEEGNYPKEKVGSANFSRHPWRRIAAVGAGVMLIVTIMTASFFLTRPTHPPVSVTPTSVSSQPGANARLAPATAPQTQKLPCTVNLRTWTDGSSDWKVRNGVLLNDGMKSWDGRSGPTIVAPCDATSAAEWSSTNYAVETKIQVTGSQNQACFGIAVRGTSTFSGWQGYKAGVGDCLEGLDRARVSGPVYPYDSLAKNASFNPGTTIHTYRVEVEDTAIKLSIDGRLVLNVTDTRYLTGAEIGLWCQHVQLAVSSFKVTSLGNE
jgi:hypothetical protein